jgi:CcmD family protein
VIDIADLIYLYVAYTIVWLGLFAYVLYLHLKQSKLTKDLELLGEMVGSYEKSKRKGKRKGR